MQGAWLFSRSQAGPTSEPSAPWGEESSNALSGQRARVRPWGVPSDLTVISALDVSLMEAAMSDVSTMRSHAPRRPEATILDACMRAAVHGLALLIAAIADELRIRRDMRQLAAMDDHMLKDIGLRRSEIAYCVRYGRDG
jgi:uncharacterized protein YjiS (DUF1127 family)